MYPFPRRYGLEAVVGLGAYSTVAVAIDTVTEERVAIKFIANIDCDAITSKQAVRELFLLSSLRHKNVIPLYESQLLGNQLFFVFEYCKLDLHSYIYNYDKTKHSIPKNVATYIEIFHQILEGIRFIHASGALHRDIKPANILINEDAEVKICDFGLSRLENEVNEEATKLTEYMVTRWYRAPEVILNPGIYGKAQDVWAAGCTLAELVLQAPLFPGKDTFDQLQVIVNVMGSPKARDIAFAENLASRRFVESLSADGELYEQILEKVRSMDPSLASLMRNMLQFNPNLRITAEEAVRQSLFSHLHTVRASSEPVSWTLYHETMARIESSSNNLSRLRILRNCVTKIRSELHSDVGDQVEPSVVSEVVDPLPSPLPTLSGPSSTPTPRPGPEKRSSVSSSCGSSIASMLLPLTSRFWSWYRPTRQRSQKVYNSNNESVAADLDGPHDILVCGNPRRRKYVTTMAASTVMPIISSFRGWALIAPPDSGNDGGDRVFHPHHRKILNFNRESVRKHGSRSLAGLSDHQEVDSIQERCRVVQVQAADSFPAPVTVRSVNKNNPFRKRERSPI